MIHHTRSAAAAFAIMGLADLSVCTASNLQSDTAVSEPVQRQLAAGEKLFVTHCANCHGSRGEGGIGPALAGHDLSLQVILETMANGRTGTPMPAFKDDLDARTFTDIAAYVLWLSSGGRLSAGVMTTTATVELRRQRPSSQPIVVGTGTGTPARGALLFFDASRLATCRVCHSYDKKGGPVGADLSLLRLTPADVYSKITHPRVAAAGYPLVGLVLRDGYSVAGIQDEETADSLSIFDLSALPPIRRTFMKAEIQSMDTPRDRGAFDHTTLPFSRQELRDLSAFLGAQNPGLTR
jgi:mono/diheme cytochrome c family protein